MEADTLVEQRPPALPRAHRPQHRTTSTRPASSAPRAATTAAPAPERAGKVYRTTYLPPGLHVALVGLYVLVLLGGVALGVGLAHYLR